MKWGHWRWHTKKLLPKLQSLKKQRNVLTCTLNVSEWQRQRLVGHSHHSIASSSSSASCVGVDTVLEIEVVQLYMYRETQIYCHVFNIIELFLWFESGNKVYLNIYIVFWRIEANY